VVVSTKTIPRETMLDTLVWSSFIQTFHINGLSTYIARYLAKHQDIDYSEFYEDLYAWVQKDLWFQLQFIETRSYFENWMTKGRIDHPRIGNIEVFGWNLMHRTTLYMVKDKMINYVFESLDKFLSNHYNIDSQVKRQLLQFQRNYVIDYRDLKSLPITQEFDYDFLGYILDNTELENSTVYQFATTESPGMSEDRFLENMYFGRKRNFGKTTITYATT